MAITKSKVLIIGATGYIGKNVCKASVKQGHPTFILVRSLISADPAKAELIKSFQESGVTALKSLVSAFRQVDVVNSTVGGASLVDQIKILQAATEAGTIKRFLPSEFGIEVDRLELEFRMTDGLFGDKRKVRRAIEKFGIPYTYVAWCLRRLDNIGTFTIKAIDDHRTQNRILHIRPKENITISIFQVVSNEI
ncbi:protein MpLAR-like3 [Marchantia polymorpha subsp. ruderalis]|uniref:NmrA-like domain-containing protein n=1 Tax=Marchantia polymorpha TaxID=3197 RepID=A0A2R6X7X2_MARPO|nr:hypothetical protein MARPO_0031s0158 [Marchantia polymorpha]BBN01143.1 hypothetical protein Mp_2g05040 [Marchantia polymorpha subsp. ruderalis]|eukprot:PTQ42193.1 hypothetical protein MARPO_0031s0158 [Marchantia polymorpha]